MDEARRFREIIVARGGKPTTPSTRLLAWLRAGSLSERAVATVGAYALKKSAYVGSIDFYSAKGILGVNGEDAIPIAMRDGLLIVGGCPNGVQWPWMCGSRWERPGTLVMKQCGRR
jgi:hypothetical protein